MPVWPDFSLSTNFHACKGKTFIRNPEDPGYFGRDALFGQIGEIWSWNFHSPADSGSENMQARKGLHGREGGPPYTQSCVDLEAADEIAWLCCINRLLQRRNEQVYPQVP